jgi:predicted PurR-regulated permease PerM
VISRLAAEMDEVLGAFLRGQLLVMLALGIIYSVGLWIVGLNVALVVGMIAGLASIVPYLGFIIGVASAIGAALVQFGDLTPLIYIAIVFGVGQALESMLLTPMLVGDKIGLHPVAVIFAIMAGGQLFGFVGILVALPVAAMIMVLVRHLHGRYKSSSMYGQDNQEIESIEVTNEETIDSDEQDGTEQTSGTDNNASPA